MKRIFLLLIAVFMFGCASNQNNIKYHYYNYSHSKFKDDFNLINSNMQHAKYKKALKIINFLIGNKIKDVRLFYDRAICNSNLKLYSKAIDDFDIVIKNAQNLRLKSNAYVGEGYCFYQIGNKEKAIDNFKKAIELNKNYLAFYSLGTIYMQDEKYIQAKIQFYLSIKNATQFIPSYINMGKCYIKLGEFEKARDILLSAMDFDDNNPGVYYNLGYTYYFLNDYKMSILYYTKALNLDPMFAPAYVNRGLVYLYLNEQGKACSDFKQACKLSLCDKLNDLKQIGICQ